MYNKLYSNIIKIKKKFINYIKLNYKILLIDIIILSLFFIPTNYEINCPGSLIDISKRITVSDSYKQKGSMNITFVKSKGDKLGMVLLSYVIPSWDLVKKEKSVLPKEDYDDANKRYKLDLKKSTNTAVELAYTKANKEIKTIKTNIYISYVNSNNDILKVGDKILKIDNINIKDSKNITNYINTKKINDYINISLIRNNNEKQIKVKLKECENNRACIGVLLQSLNIYKTKPDIKIKYKRNERGASSGLMNTLYIYNSLTKKDLTKGLKISGTGVINEDGSVEAIDGVKYKLIGAVNKNADIFIVPKDNYNEASKLKKKNKYKIKLLKANSFDQVVSELQK